MVSSLCVFFLVACYLFFKQHYQKLVDTQIEDTEQRKVWNTKLKRKLMILPFGIIAIFVLYAISYTLMKVYPDVDNVKASRRVVDIVTALACFGIFFWDKRELDKKLGTQKPEL